ncbi:MAG: hypothetical protein RLZZ488_1815 [Pseudomonadota bacterium]|jgi:TM2 domain-containing membrane protein YozV
MNNSDTNSTLSREKAVKLALVLGWAGAHRFYTHQTVSGIAYLLFCWTLIPGLLSLIDAAFLARMSDDDFADEFFPAPHLQAQPVRLQRTTQLHPGHSRDLTA